MSDAPIIDEDAYPGLYQSADQASLSAQRTYFLFLFFYLSLLVLAAAVAFVFPNIVYGAITSALLFFATLGILIYLRIYRPDDVWYNGRAVAESVKTITWRWMMRADPYLDCADVQDARRQLISDLKKILEQNKSLSHSLNASDASNDAITACMAEIRALPIEQRLITYREQRIENQSDWYTNKSGFNKSRARLWFWISVGLHLTAIVLLLFKISSPQADLPIEVIATAAGAVLTWLQAKKHNELGSSYSLAKHEIGLIKGEAEFVETEEQFSDFVINSESAFSREHTQWVARKVD